MLKLTRHVFAWSATRGVADFYERGLFNSILGTMNPRDGMTMYFVPLAGGYWRTLPRPLDRSGAARGTGVESFAKLGDSIYFHDAIRSGSTCSSPQLNWAEKGLPWNSRPVSPNSRKRRCGSGSSNLSNSRFVCVPSWAVRKGILGQAQRGSTGGARKALELPRDQTYLEGGDTLEVRNAHEPSPRSDARNPNLARESLYGPIVLVGRLDELSNEQRNEHNTSPSGAPCPVPWFTVDDNDLNSWIEPSGSRPLEFRTRGRQTNVTLEPSYSLFGHHYAVYWEIFRTGSPAHRAKLTEIEQRRQLAARTVDTVDIGDATSESAHALSGERTGSGSGNNRHWRHAYDGGWFSYRMKVAADEPMTLQCDFWGSESPPRRFDILVDGTKITTLELNHNQPGRFFTTETDLPPHHSVRRRRSRFVSRAHPGNTAGGVFGLRLLRGAPQP